MVDSKRWSVDQEQRDMQCRIYISLGGGESEDEACYRISPTERLYIWKKR